MGPNYIAKMFSRNESLELLKNILNSAKSAIWSRSITNNTIWVSDQCIKIFGKTQEDFQRNQMIWIENVHPEYINIVKEALDKQSSGEETKIEYSLVHTNGEVRHVTDCAVPIMDATGKVISITNIIQDITDQKRVRDLAEKEELFRSLIECSPNSVLVHQEGKIVYVNPEAIRNLGAKHKSEVMGQPITRFMDQDNLNDWKKRMSTVSNGMQIENFTYKLHSVDGRVLDIECNGAVVAYNNKPAFLVVGTDVTKKMQLQDQLIENEERYKSLFEYNANSVYSFDIHGNFISCNKETTAICGYSKDELLKMDYLSLIITENKSDAFENFQKVVTSRMPQNFQSAITHKNGSIVHINITAVPIIVKGDIQGVFGIAQNITKEVERREIIKHLAYHDYLTGLPNRTMLERSLPIEIKDALANNENFAVLFIDLDQFKRINDTMGHAIGDQVLKEVTKRLSTSLEDNEYIFRQGGDEFIVIIPKAEHLKAKKTAKRIISLLSTPFPVDSNEVRITPSIGISIFPEDANTIETLIRYADMAMYHAKKFGKNTYCFYKTAEFNN